MKKILLYLIFGLLIAVFALKFIPRTKVNTPNTVNNYFPISIGNFWEYEGTKEEQVNGKLEKNNIKKRIEIVDITESNKGKIIKLTNGVTYLIKDNTIDFEPNEPLDKFILTFPLYIGQKWGDEHQLKNRNDGYYVWEVEKKLSQDVLGKKYDDCFRIAYKTLPDTTYKIFCYGIGIIEEGYKHNGTVMEETYKLTAFK